MIKVLVVDDSPTTSALLKYILETDPDVKVVGMAVNGKQAVQMAVELMPDVITMDVVMPDMDGVEATRQIMGIAPVPIVVVTAHADMNEPRVAFEALKAGALEVVAKPVDAGRATQDAWGESLLNTVKAVAGVDLKS
ncbi:MAG: response regulator [Desulfarculaceae bacterium]|nr:response regulator [Desulfarculaceae bacterium]MCF8046161.1 response regulator [Desulfarculaceae bacterium]MCF8065827.1 response regulator [Desulfarculaceae bacterium]MCF8097963.1 response regulator [Desulfarculaceae bacterium]MCF8123990.1 response regulator [Desulfarculaceae bacterium]